jgi:hypothetical protein
VGENVGRLLGRNVGWGVTALVVGCAVGKVDGELLVNVAVGELVMSLVATKQRVTVAGKSVLSVAGSSAM